MTTNIDRDRQAGNAVIFHNEPSWGPTSPAHITTFKNRLLDFSNTALDKGCEKARDWAKSLALSAAHDRHHEWRAFYAANFINDLQASAGAKQDGNMFDSKCKQSICRVGMLAIGFDESEIESWEHVLRASIFETFSSVVEEHLAKLGFECDALESDPDPATPKDGANFGAVGFPFFIVDHDSADEHSKGKSSSPLPAAGLGAGTHVRVWIAYRLDYWSLCTMSCIWKGDMTEVRDIQELSMICTNVLTWAATEFPSAISDLIAAWKNRFPQLYDEDDEDQLEEELKAITTKIGNLKISRTNSLRVMNQAIEVEKPATKMQGSTPCIEISGPEVPLRGRPRGARPRSFDSREIEGFKFDFHAVEPHKYRVVDEQA
ncbi:hypothetical protein GQ53DRAFT_763112 [Thozetella sp. PMI_491]|nr:hypothetical protein GQ53DRAFT_763112 [Thozetella sp. PMI_491]